MPRPWDIEFGFVDGELTLFQIRPLVEKAGAIPTRCCVACARSAAAPRRLCGEDLTNHREADAMKTDTTSGNPVVDHAVHAVGLPARRPEESGIRRLQGYLLDADNARCGEALARPAAG